MEKLWTTAEVARFLGIAESDVDALVREGKLTGYKLGGQFLRFRPDQVKTLKAVVSPRPHGTPTAEALPESWQERLRDTLYYYDFYLVSATCLVGLVFYLLLSR